MLHAHYLRPVNGLYPMRGSGMATTDCPSDRLPWNDLLSSGLQGNNPPGISLSRNSVSPDDQHRVEVFSVSG